MKTIKTQEKLLKYLDKKSNTIIINDDLNIKCNIDIPYNISAWDILARNISALDILANNISAGDISAWDISAGDISYYAVCFAYNNIKYKSIKGRRNKSKHFCLDGKITKVKPKNRR